MTLRHRSGSTFDVTTIFTAAAAVWAFAAAASLWHLFAIPASEGQAPGFMTAHGLDAHGPHRHLLFVIVATIGAAFGGRAVAARIAGRPRPALIGAAAALASSIAIFSADASSFFVAIVPLAVAVLWISRPELVPRLTLRDAALIPSTIVVAVALMRLTPMTPPDALVTAVIISIALRSCCVAIAPAERTTANAFLLVPLAMVLQATSSSALANLGALSIAVAAPLLWSGIAAKRSGGSGRDIVALIVYPLFLVAYTFALLNAYPPLLDLYENGHDLVPAMEVAKGAQYYRDVIPLHGLLSDGVFDSMAMKLVGDSVADILRFRFFVAALTAAAVFAVAAAATASADVALLAALLTITALPAQRTWIHAWPRASLSLAAVAIAVAATRRRRPVLLAIAAAVAVASILQSVDFGLFAVATVAIAPLFWSRPRIVRAAGQVARGSLAGMALVAALLAAAGILSGFLTTTFREILTLAPSFSVGFLSIDQCCPGTSSLTDIVPQAMLRPAALPYVLWPAVLIAFAVLLSKRAWTLRWRTEMVIAAWIIVASFSFANRRQDYAAILIPALAVVALFARRRRMSTASFALVAVLLVAIAHPAWHLFQATPNIARRPERVARFAPIPLPAAGGAVIEQKVVPAVVATDSYLRQALAPGETFFDFANVPALYYLTGRRSPIRQIQVAQYEDPRLQREVIAAIERNPAVRLALVRFPYYTFTLDGVSNEVRAPLVAQYLRTHFAPVYDRDGVLILRRR